MRKYIGKNYKRLVEVGIVLMLFWVAIIPAINASVNEAYFNKEIIKLEDNEIKSSKTMEVIKETVDNYLKIDENIYNTLSEPKIHYNIFTPDKSH